MSLCCICAVHSREVVDINRSWRFSPGWEVKANIFTEVNLPHTWNMDALSGKTDYYRGLGNYEKNLTIPAEYKGKKLFLKFYGVANVSNIFINGKHAQEHRGGYTAFVVDITDKVNYGESNQIWVRTSNAQFLDVMPLVGDFNMYGGIYRDVELIVADQTHISTSDYGSNGVYLSQNTTKERAQIDAKILVESAANSTPTVTIKISDKDKKVVAQTTKQVAIDGNGQGVAMLDLEVKKPNLWNGVASPYLYDVEIAVMDGQKVCDVVREKMGFRFYEVDPDRGFILNGEYLQLRGVCRHQDRLEIGNALHKIHHQQDIDIMLEMGVNAVRLSHYPQSKYFHELCDKYGIILWSEIPFVGPGGFKDKGFVDQESFKENGKTQLKELIRQNYNHPSICFWGLFNELKPNGDNPVEYIRELNALAHSEDPTRVTTAASNLEGEMNTITDVMAWNRYFGWYAGKMDGMGEWADDAHKRFADTPIGISEYGAGGSILHQQEELVQTKPISYWHPENWQTYYHEENWKAIAPRPFIWGSFVWIMFDFGAAHRVEGEIKGKNDKGLVTFDRKFKKDAFYFYKANWNQEDKFVYFADRRLDKRSKALQDIKVYSNCQDLTLYVNDKKVGEIKEGDYGIFLWKGVELAKGDNTLKVTTAKGSITDKIEIFITE